MKVLVTGGTGFIGQYLIKELIRNDYEVRALSREIGQKRKDVELVVGDITKPKTLSQAFKNIDAVFHNAAYAMDWGPKKEFQSVNVEGTRNVSEACKNAGIKYMVYTSSAGVYGFPNSKVSITEDSALSPLNEYARSKLQGEKILLSNTEINVLIVRPVLVLGAGATAAHLLLSKLVDGTMRYIGDGTQHISIVHPADVAQCLRLSLERGKPNEVYNAVSFACSIKDLFEEASKALEVEPPERHVPYIFAYVAAIMSELFAGNKKEPSLTRFRAKSFGTFRDVSYTKAKKTLNYKPHNNLATTVKDMVSWYNTQFNNTL